MQQYFANEKPVVGEDYIFTKEQAHHARTVVRLDHEIVRLVYEGHGYFAEAYTGEDGVFKAHVFEEDPQTNELHVRIILAMALIRREKMELVLKKAAELGVSEIIPFESSRCVVHAKKEKSARQKERWETILMEASQQCKRSCIPMLHEITEMRSLMAFDAELKLCAYENAYGTGKHISEAYSGQKTVLAVIGPEGGFSQKEVEEFYASGFESITLGARILRAETAALYTCSVLAEITEK